MECLMKKLVINLARRTDRKEHFLKVNSKLKNYEWLTAIDASDVNHRALKSIGFSSDLSWRDPYLNRKLKSSEVACTLSHRQAWLKCVELDEPVLILEDDAIIGDRYTDKQAKKLIKNYDLVYFGRNENKPDQVVSIDDELEVPAYPYNTHAYAITPKVAQQLLDGRVDQAIIPSDEYLSIMIKDMNVVAFKDDVIRQAPRALLSSDIENGNEADFYIDFKTHAVTIGTDIKKCAPLNDTAAMYGVYPKNLGKGVDWQGGTMQSTGGGHKINILRDYINTLPDNDVVIFTDAYDVMYFSDLEEITRRYLGFCSKVLFSAETEIWPDKSLADKFPDGGTKYRYLNSGTFIGVVSELKKILNSATIENSSDDQLFYQQAFLSGNYDIKLDYEGYIFQCHEPQVRYDVDQNKFLNPVTNTFGCIYHGNGGDEAKKKFNASRNSVKMSAPMLYIPNYKGVDVISDDMLVIDFMTQSQCEDLIAMSDNHGGWEPLEGDKFPAYEIRMKQFGAFEALERHWEKNIYPITHQFWKPTLMYGLRDAFVMRYCLETQKSLNHHCDASMITGSVKLNDNYEGADLVFPRQNISNKDIDVGKCILFPGMVTHGHMCEELTSGVKYSLTMWTSRFKGDVL